MTRLFKIITAVLGVFLCTGLINPAPASAITDTATQTVIINATSAAWENNIDTHILSSEAPLRYIVSNAIGDIVTIQVDGDTLSPTDYSIETITSGMTYFTVVLSPDYLNTLALGQYSMDVIFDNTNVLSDIFFIELELLPPNTGAMFGGLGNIISDPVALAVITSVVIFTLIALYFTHLRRPQMAQLRIASNKRLIVITALLATTALTGAIIINNAPQPAIAAPTTPVIDLSPDTLVYNLIAGGTGTSDFQSTITTPIFATDYTLSAVSDNTNSNIDLKISGGSLAAPTTLPAAPSSPLTVRNFTGSSYSGHTSNYALTVTLGNNIPFGTYIIEITYTIDTTDQDYFMFTVDTRMTNTVDTNPTHYDGTATTFAIPTSGTVDNSLNSPYSWLIDWGDDSTPQTASGSGNITSAGIPYTYATPGQYQITITSNGPPTSGWMNAFGFYSNTSGANIQSNKNMLKSIDTPLFDSMRTPNVPNRFALMFYGARNASSIPANLFSRIDTSGAANVSSMFRGTFSYYAFNNTTATIPAGLFDSIDTSSATDFGQMFNDTFYEYARNSTVATIPAGLFNSINTSNGINLSRMFNGTFQDFSRNSTVATIPANLFSSINASKATNLYEMFRGTFYYYARGVSSAATIPAGLFSINAPVATDLSRMFYDTFNRYAYDASSVTVPSNLFSITAPNATTLSQMFFTTFSSFAHDSGTVTLSPNMFSINAPVATNLSQVFRMTFSSGAYYSKATIPAGLFSINAPLATDLSQMFSGTFEEFAYFSTTGTIPAGLFSSISTNNSTDLSNMFSSTFNSYARNSTVGTIPAGLFSTIDTSNTTTLPQMFGNTFNSYARNSTVGTIPADLFSTIDTSSATTLNSLFVNTFYYYANHSTVGTIPANLFNSISTSGVTNLHQLFAYTFYEYARSSTVGTIPAGLFDTINTSSATVLSDMLNSTFENYAYNSTVAAIPTDLFDFLDLSSATDLTRMFSSTFRMFAYMRLTISTDINDIWGNANFASKITPANAGGIFQNTFYGVRLLGGTGKTFIDTKLGGIVPDVSTQAFAGTQLSDLYALGDNWK